MKKTFRIKNEHLTKWLEALRSGKYVQGKNALKREDGSFCCLGVLQDVLDGKVEVSTPNYKPLALPTAKWIESKGIEDLTNRPGLGDYFNPKLYVGKKKILLPAAECNDHHGCTFTDIATMLEEAAETY
jgi:hypothetical protein